MAGVLHGSARTTPRLRAELQASQASSRALATRYGVKSKMVAKWRQRNTAVEAPMAHVLAFVTACNCAKHLKALRWRTPSQAICVAWTRDPSVRTGNPHHPVPEPHN